MNQVTEGIKVTTPVWSGLRQHKKNTCFAIAVGSVGNYYGVWSLSSQDIEACVEQLGYQAVPIGWGEAEKLIQAALGEKPVVCEVLQHRSPDRFRPITDAVAKLQEHLLAGYAAILSFREIGTQNFHAFTIHGVNKDGTFEVWNNFAEFADRKSVV